MEQDKQPPSPPPFLLSLRDLTDEEFAAHLERLAGGFQLSSPGSRTAHDLREAARRIKRQRLTLPIDVEAPQLSIPTVTAHRAFANHLDTLADDFLEDSEIRDDLKDAARRIRELAIRPATVRCLIKSIQMELNILRRLMEAHD